MKQVATAKHTALQKDEEWHREYVSVDTQTLLPRNNKIPTGSGKIATIGKVEINQVHRHQDGDVFLAVLRTEEPSINAEEPEIPRCGFR